MPRPGPVERIRRALEARAGPELAALLPGHYQRLGRVVLVRWPEPLRPEFPTVARELAEALRAETVGRIVGPASGTRRRPSVELLYGSSTETEVVEDGIRFRFDAAELLYSRGNRTERARLARLVRPPERVADLFAGIGYFALPAARHGAPVELVAVEENPASYRYLAENVRRNGLEAVVRPVLGDNRSVELGPPRFDRIVLGYLPDSLPWLPRAVGLLAPEGGWVHVHTLEGVRDLPGELRRRTEEALAPTKRPLVAYAPRVVKSYGPGRRHVVVDLRVGAEASEAADR